MKKNFIKFLISIRFNFKNNKSCPLCQLEEADMVTTVFVEIFNLGFTN